jgi:hypothetical protein
LLFPLQQKSHIDPPTATRPFGVSQLLFPFGKMPSLLDAYVQPNVLPSPPAFPTNVAVKFFSHEEKKQMTGRSK